jgi:CubicO group peptidase (beta-lactamase class C family)
MPEGVTPEMMTDWEVMCTAIAAQKPLWEPGTKTGYHAWTFGWLIGEIVRRVDGRPLAQFAREELCQPLGIEDFYLGIPDSVESRVATLKQAPPSASIEPDALNLQVMPPQVTSAEVVNRPDVRRASIPGGGGIMSARAIARHYAMLAGHGVLGEIQLLSAGRIDTIRTLQTDGYDDILGRRARKGLGYFLGGDPNEGGDARMGLSSGAFGHPGKGGSLGFADPTRKLAFGFTKNLMRDGLEQDQTSAYLVAEAIRNYIAQRGGPNETA